MNCHARFATYACQEERNLTSPFPVKWQSSPPVYRPPKVSPQSWPLIRLSGSLAAWAALLHARSCQLLCLPMFAKLNYSKCWSRPMMSLFNSPCSTSTDPSASVSLPIYVQGRDRGKCASIYIFVSKGFYTLILSHQSAIVNRWKWIKGNSYYF